MNAQIAAGRLIAGAMLALLCGPALAQAPAIEKYVTPDGKVIYSDSPVPGAQSVKKLDTPPPQTNSGPERRSNPSVSAAPSATSGGAPKDDRLDAATLAVRNAAEALEAAKNKLEFGREPRENERQGTAGGRSRLNDQYFERIKELEKGVEDAQARLDEAYRARNNLR